MFSNCDAASVGNTLAEPGALALAPSVGIALAEPDALALPELGALAEHDAPDHKIIILAVPCVSYLNSGCC